MVLAVRVTVPELADANGVSVRTMGRRLAAMRDAGRLVTERRGPHAARRTFVVEQP
jgi:predicted DNA-binding transcriptional regulator YafY